MRHGGTGARNLTNQEYRRMRQNTPARPPIWRPNLILLWLGMGLAFHLVYFGIPFPLRIGTWLHVLFWPVYVLLGMIRWIFYPFAMVALVCFAVMFISNSRR